MSIGSSPRPRPPASALPPQFGAQVPPCDRHIAFTPPAPDGTTIAQPLCDPPKCKPARKLITDIPAYSPIVPRQIKSKQAGRTTLPSSRFNTVFDTLEPMTPLDPLEQVYMKHEDGSGRVGSTGLARKRKHAYDGDGLCGERVILADKEYSAETKQGKELRVTSVPLKAGRSAFKPLGRAFEICQDEEDKQKPAKPYHTPLLPSLDLCSRSPSKRTPSKVPKRSRKAHSPQPSAASPDSVDRSSPTTAPPASPSAEIRSLAREIRSLTRENRELRGELHEAQDTAVKYSRRANRFGKEADQAEKDRLLAQAAAAAKEVKVTELRQRLETTRDELNKAQEAAGEWERSAQAEQDTRKQWEKEVEVQRGIAQQAEQRLSSHSAVVQQLEAQLADATMQLHCLQAALEALPPIQNPLFPTQFDFTSTRRALLCAKTETAKERNESQQLRKEVNRYISAQAVWAEEKAQLQEEKQKADEAREASLVSSGHKIALLNDEHEEQFAEMEAQLQLMEELNRQLEARDGELERYRTEHEALQLEMVKVKAECNQQEHRSEWYKKELEISQKTHLGVKAELEEARERVGQIVKQLEVARHQASAGTTPAPSSPTDKTPPAIPTGPKAAANPVRAEISAIPTQPAISLQDQLNAAQSRMRSLEKLVHDKEAEITRQRQRANDLATRVQDLSGRCHIAESRVYRAEKEVEYLRYRETQQARYELPTNYGGGFAPYGGVYRSREDSQRGTAGLPMGPKGRRRSLADRISKTPAQKAGLPEPSESPTGATSDGPRRPRAATDAQGSAAPALTNTLPPVSAEAVPATGANGGVSPTDDSDDKSELEDGEIKAETSDDHPGALSHKRQSETDTTSDTPSLVPDTSSRSGDANQSQELSPLTGWGGLVLPSESPYIPQTDEGP